MAPVSNNMCIEKLDDIVNKYDNTCHSTIKLKAADANSSTHNDFNREINKEDSKFEVGDQVKSSKLYLKMSNIA